MKFVRNFRQRLTICMERKKSIIIFHDRRFFLNTMQQYVFYRFFLVSSGSHVPRLPLHCHKMVDELLGRPAGKTAAPHLKPVGFITDLLITHLLRRDPGPACQLHSHRIEAALIRLGVIDGKAEPVHQGQLFLHGVGPVHVLSVLHGHPGRGWFLL